MAPNPQGELPSSSDSTAAATTPAGPSSAAPASSRRSPSSRYVVRDTDAGRHLTCLAAQNIAVRIERGQTVTAAAAKRAAEGTIFLDGAAQGAPFMEVKGRVFNLDHHEGCVRAFTLATCEQAMVMVRKGLDLNAGEWTIHANEPDLDTVLAIWILLNHVQINADDPTTRQAIMPLVRLEGVIDAHGLGMVELCAFPDDFLAEVTSALELVHSHELELKQHGQWASTDFLTYTAEVLSAVDRLVYSPDRLEELSAVEELARISIADDQLAIVCRSEAGIYEVEQALAEQHKDRVGLIVLQKDATTYTLRQVHPFLPVSLDAIYDRLNLIDPAVRGSNRWGGSSDIGGSPRATGTRLASRAIVSITRWTYGGAPLWRRLAAIGLGLLPVVVLAAAAWGAIRLIRWDADPESQLGRAGITMAHLASRPWFAASVLTVAILAYAAHALRNRRLYGAQAPTGLSWLALAPVAAVAGAAGGAWLAPEALGRGASALLAGLPLAVAAELLLRGVAHGRLAGAFSAPLGRLSWPPSLPTSITAALYALLTALAVVPALLPLGGLAAAWRIGSVLLAALVLGTICGMARERSESILGPVLLHALAVVVAASVALVGA